MKSNDLVSFLKEKTSLFADIPEDVVRETIEDSRIVTFEPHEAVIEFGETGRFLGILLEGKAEISVVDNAGNRKRLSAVESAGVFGEMSVMTGDRTVADVIGVTRCKALLVPEEVVTERLMTVPAAIKALSRIITDRSRALAVENEREGVEKALLNRDKDPYGMRLHAETPLKILVINNGSSSLKFSLFDTTGTMQTTGAVERIGTSSSMSLSIHHGGRVISRELGAGRHADALKAAFDMLRSQEIDALDRNGTVDLIGHRVVHGGKTYGSAAIIDEKVEEEIDRLSELAPLHNPVNLLGIREARRLFPSAVHVAVFDTAFHHTMPSYAHLYGLPYEYYEKDGVRRYGFHGTSHMYVALKASEFLKRPFNELEVVTCHLGNGASLCAVDHGRSVDTTMGMTPTEGLIMGTRCGDIDPGAISYLLRTGAVAAEQLDELLQNKSGLLGLSGISNDMREIESAAQAGDHRALLAYKAFSYRIRKYIGAYSAAMGGLDVVVFTGGIGQGSAGVRSLACQGLEHMGIRIDDQRNREAGCVKHPVAISTEDSQVDVLVIPANEELMIAREALRAIGRRSASSAIQRPDKVPVPIEISAHHVHLSQAHVEALFGAGHELTPISDLSQPGQFACKEQVDLVGPKGRVARVRVLGPARSQTQVEIAMTEQFKLGLHPPIRESGDLKGTPGIALEGVVGTVELAEGVICALRHIHMTPEDALRMGLRDRYVVRVRVEGDRELIFGDVLVRVSPEYKLSMHLDTDEANAANLKNGTIGYIDEIQDRGL